jgi:hypothetical protein
MAVAPLSKDRGLKPGEITREALIAAHPGSGPAPNDPRALLQSLRLSETGFARNAGASFVAWTKGTGADPGRYFVVIDGLGLPDSLK